jgi:hypothetical protein
MQEKDGDRSWETSFSRAFVEALGADEKLVLGGLFVTVPEFIKKIAPRDLDKEIEAVAHEARQCDGGYDDLRKIGKKAWELALEVSDNSGGRQEQLRASVMAGFLNEITGTGLRADDMEALLAAFPDNLELPGFGKAKKDYIEMLKKNEKRDDIEKSVARAKTAADATALAKTVVEHLNKTAPLPKKGKNTPKASDIEAARNRAGALTHFIAGFQQNNKDLMMEFLKALPADESAVYDGDVISVHKFIKEITPRDIDAEFASIVDEAKGYHKDTEKIQAAGYRALRLTEELTDPMGKSDKKNTRANIITKFVVMLTENNIHPDSMQNFFYKFSNREPLNTGGDKMTLGDYIKNYPNRWLSGSFEALINDIEGKNAHLDKMFDDMYGTQYKKPREQSLAEWTSRIYREAHDLNKKDMAMNIVTGAIVAVQRSTLNDREFIKNLENWNQIRAGNKTMTVSDLKHNMGIR